MFLGHVKARCRAKGGTEPYHKLSNVVVGIKAGILMWTLREELTERARNKTGQRTRERNWELGGSRKKGTEREIEEQRQKTCRHLRRETHLNKMGASSPILNGQEGKHFFALFFLSASVSKLCSSVCSLISPSFHSRLRAKLSECFPRCCRLPVV